jgi:hypothetical protein
MWHDRIQAYAMANTVRTQTHRLTVYLDGQGNQIYIELFDYAHDLCAHDLCAHDPLETTNFAKDHRYESVGRDMRALLNAGWQNCIPGNLPKNKLPKKHAETRNTNIEAG